MKTRELSRENTLKELNAKLCNLFNEIRTIENAIKYLQEKS